MAYRHELAGGIRAVTLIFVMVGERAPDFVLSDQTGRTRTLSEMLVDGPMVLFFYPVASSPLSTAETCRFRELGSEFTGLGVQRVGISTDDLSRQSRFAERRAVDHPLLCDSRSQVAAEFGVRRRMFGPLGQALLRVRESRGGRHTRPGPLTRWLLSAKRTTFVIDTDRTVLKVISSELRAGVHADLALHYLRTRRPRAVARIPMPRPSSERVRISLSALRGGAPG
jgi:peroxiredoxin Q/BCP